MRAGALVAAMLVAGLAAAAAARAEAPTSPLVPTLAASAPTAAGFAPPGWTLETEIRGDLDGDGRADAAFVLRPEVPDFKPASSGFKLDENPRLLGVATAAADGSLRLAVQNATLIPRHFPEGRIDSFEGGLRIERGALKVIFDLDGGGSWHGSRTYTFRLGEGRLTAIGYDQADVQRGPGDLDMISVNYLTGRMSRSKGTIESEKEKKVWTKLRTKRSPTIEEIGDGTEFDPAK